jgi:hypothetical protein
VWENEGSGVVTEWNPGYYRSPEFRGCRLAQDRTVSRFGLESRLRLRTGACRGGWDVLDSWPATEYVVHNVQYVVLVTLRKRKVEGWPQGKANGEITLEEDDPLLL